MSLKVNSLLLATTLQKIYQVPAGIEASVHGLVFSNNSSIPITFNLTYYKNSTNSTFQLAEEFTILPRKSYTWPRPINMEPGDFLESLANTNDSVTVTASYFENDKKIAKGFTVRGLWDEESSYEINDVVTFQGATFVALEESSGISPEDTTKWILFIPRGEKGDQGDQGEPEPDVSAVKNVIYVSKSGNDLNDGSTLQLSKLTIRSALQAATVGTTVFVKSGDYIENNPLTVPENVAVWGDSLRTVTVRPKNKTKDLFWVKNGSYLSQMTFKDYEAPSAAVCFPPDGSAGSIFTSPYVQNCTSITTTGTGMRVDGTHVEGLKSMVVDAYTQYNQGGIGIHMLNRGNTQLVSVFTICCDIGFLCESGGFCSVTNSNSSFGNFALKSDGVSEVLYSGKTKGVSSGRELLIDNLIVKPNVGDAVKFNGISDFFTVASSTDFTRGGVEIVSPNVSAQPADRKTARSILLDFKNKIQIDTIDYLNRIYPKLNYNQFKATRDTGLVIDAVANDIAFRTNYNSLLAAFSYTRASAQNLVITIRNETVDSLIFAKKQSLRVLSQNYSKNSEIYKEAENGFNLIIDTVLNGTGSSLQENIAQTLGSPGSDIASKNSSDLIDLLVEIVLDNNTHPTRILPDYSWVDQDLQNKFSLLQNNRDILKTQVTSWIFDNFPDFEYDVQLCERDIRIIVESVSYDMLFGTNFKSIIAGISYYRSQASLVLQDQLSQTIGAFNYLKSKMLEIVDGLAIAETRVSDSMDIILDILENGLGSVPAYDLSSTPTNFDQGYANAVDLLKLNREFIQKEVIEYIDITNPAFEYNKEKCSRDSEIIIQGIYYDAALGTNYKSLINGISYQRNMTSKVITEQLTETVGALRFLKLEIQNRLENDLLLTKRNFNLFEEIVNIIELNNVAEIQWSDPGLNSSLKFARIQLQNNKIFAKTELIDWIEYNYVNFDQNYDAGICARDVGLILDAVSYDLITGSNFPSSVAGSAYFRIQSELVTSKQLIQTLAAFRHVKEIVASSVDPSLVTEINAAFDNILNILENGLSSVPSYVFPTNGITDTDGNVTGNTFQNNRSTYQTAIANFLNTNYSSLWSSLGTQGQEACTRDVGYIVDAVTFDVKYGGNYQSVIAGDAYYSFGTLQIVPGEVTATLAAYAELKNLLQNDAETSKVSNVGVLLDNIIDIITNGAGTVTTVFPSETGESSTVQSTFTTLQNNKSSIKSSTTQFITDNFNSFTYDTELCERDIELIIDAVSYDIQYGGNSAVIEAAKSYFDNVSSVLPQDEKTITVAAYRQLKTILSEIVLEQYQGQDVSSNPATQQEAESVGDLIEIIASVIEDDDLESLPETVFPDLSWVDRKTRSILENVLTDKEEIVENTILFIDHTYGFVYDRAVCERDVGYIVDSLLYDLTYGGNSETISSANSYYSKNQLQIPEKERLATAAAYRYLKSLVRRISLSVEIGSLPTLFLETANAPTLPQNAITLINLNRDFIKDQMTKFIEVNFQTFSYDEQICSRDVGLVIDALSYDLVFNSNFKTIIAGTSYYRAQASEVIEQQKLPTIRSLEYLKTLLLDVVKENPIAVQRITDTFDIILAVIENGLDAVPTISIPDPDDYSVNLGHARNSIQINYEFIQEEAIAFISINFPSLDYDSTVCRRDIRYVLDAIVYDITYGGNSESIGAARSYYSNAVLQIPSGELTPTITTFDFIRQLLADIILNNAVTPLQINAAQNFGVTATNSEVTIVNQLVSDIITLLDDQNAGVQKINPDITWTPQLLQDQFLNLQNSKALVKPQVINWINERFLNFVYDQEVCQRDLDLILNAVTYDLRYEGNSETANAADEYYSGGVLQIPGETFQTVEAFKYVNKISQLIVLNESVAPLQEITEQVFNNNPASENEANRVNDLLSIVSNIIENAYSSVVTLEETVSQIPNNITVTFHQYSLITSSGHTFEWIGAGTNVNTALPYLGGTPLTENQAVELDGGKIYFTGTDQRGDFRIGRDFVINQNTGTISGRTFTRSLFAVMTPYILAIGD